ncbi:MAG: aminomethyl-transferring glycine dehydrogenase [Planctomycetaceae bacterium]|nr:aminomethyl-transferring glycine dehydrogenase [Planctomycetaceae bacterium]
MAYLFDTPQQKREMLDEIGIDSVDALFEQIPEAMRLQRPLDLPPALTEPELERWMRQKAAAGDAGICFQGGGVYDHFIPAAVDEIASRGEFYTAYTPYQAEASQGSLQAFFEYQTLVCQLTGMDVSNASIYEGGTSLSEAALMAMRITKRHGKVVVLGSVHPEYRQVLRTYVSHLNCEVIVIPTPDGTADTGVVESALDDQTACLILQHPNFFGCLEQAEELCQLANNVGALSVVSFDPISCGILKRPGQIGADIAVAEGQALGTPMQFGGPFLGMIACRDKYMRQLPGRLIGQAEDRNGERCFVLAIQAREQHIRREKAKSNICTNQGLIALRATVYLSLLGKEGIREAAELCCRKANYAAAELAKVDGIDVIFDRPVFKEFVIRSQDGSEAIIQRAKAAGFDIGPSLETLAGVDGVLVAVTEQRTREEIDALVAALAN